MAKKNKNEKTQVDQNKSIDDLKKQIFEIKLSKSIAGTYDKKKLKEVKDQIRALYVKSN